MGGPSQSRECATLFEALIPTTTSLKLENAATLRRKILISDNHLGTPAVLRSSRYGGQGSAIIHQKLAQSLARST